MVDVPPGTRPFFFSAVENRALSSLCSSSKVARSATHGLSSGSRAHISRRKRCRIRVDSKRCAGAGTGTPRASRHNYNAEIRPLPYPMRCSERDQLENSESPFRAHFMVEDAPTLSALSQCCQQQIHYFKSTFESLVDSLSPNSIVLLRSLTSLLKPPHVLPRV